MALDKPFQHLLISAHSPGYKGGWKSLVCAEEVCYQQLTCEELQVWWSVRPMPHNKELCFPVGLAHSLRKKLKEFNGYSERIITEALSAILPPPQKEFSTTGIRDNVLFWSNCSCWAPSAAESQNIAHCSWSTMCWKGEVSLYYTACYQHPDNEPFGGCLRNYPGWKGKL